MTQSNTQAQGLQESIHRHAIDQSLLKLDSFRDALGEREMSPLEARELWIEGRKNVRCRSVDS